MGFTTTTNFWIFNDGYDNLQFKKDHIKIANNIDQLPLKLSYPDGRRMGVTKKMIKVIVQICLPKPMSFTKKLVFIATDKK